MVIPVSSNTGNDENCETESITCGESLEDVPMLSQSILTCNDSQIIESSPSTSLEITNHSPEFLSSIDESDQNIDVIHQTEPYHPSADFSFPSKEFGNRTYRCQADFFTEWTFLHYEIITDRVICYICSTAKRLKLIHAETSTPFINGGYGNWKEARARIANHANSKIHNFALDTTITIPYNYQDVSEMLSSEYAKQKVLARDCLFEIASGIRFVARQGLPLRGHNDEKNSNFQQLMNLLSAKNKCLSDWLTKKTDRYTSHDIQNEMIGLMAHDILRDIAKKHGRSL